MMAELLDLAELDEPIILMTAVFDDEIWYGFGDLMVKVKREPPAPPPYERPRLFGAMEL